MQMKNMGKNKDEGQVARQPLPRVSSVGSKRILLRIRMARSGDPNASDRMENERNKDKKPFDQRKGRPKIMDQIDVGLESTGTVEQACIGQQMDTHVGPDRYQTAQGMESADQEFVPYEEGNRAWQRRWDAHSSSENGVGKEKNG